MEVSNGNGKQKGRSLKKAKTSDHGRDFISDLPDPILAHILSFLPLKYAIKTALLRRFGDLWRSMQVLDLDSCFYHNCDENDYGPDYINEKFVNVIRHVLNLHDNSTLDRLSLKFCFRFTYTRGGESDSDDVLDNVEWEKRTADEIEKLIHYALNRKVKILDLDLKGCESVEPWEFYNLPNVLRSNHLTCLKLAAFDITYCKEMDLKSLRILVLDNVSLSDDIMEVIFLGCPVLENLSLVDCFGIDVLDCRTLKLKKLLLALNEEHSHVLVSCPHVLSLDIYGSIKRAWLCDVSSVVDASICLGYLFSIQWRQYARVFMLLDMFSQCKTFTLCTWSILVLSIWSFIDTFRPFLRWKSLTLKLSPTKWHLPGLSFLFSDSQSLETLTIYIYPGYYDIFKERVVDWIQACEFDGDSYWDSQVATFPCLETIMIYGYVDEPYVIQMVEFLLKRATRLQKLVISTKESLKTTCKCWYVGHAVDIPHYTTVQLQLLSRKFGSLPRASREVAINFS